MWLTEPWRFVAPSAKCGHLTAHGRCIRQGYGPPHAGFRIQCKSRQERTGGGVPQQCPDSISLLRLKRSLLSKTFSIGFLDHPFLSVARDAQGCYKACN